jgi:hypothetical protein
MAQNRESHDRAQLVRSAAAAQPRWQFDLQAGRYRTREVQTHGRKRRNHHLGAKLTIAKLIAGIVGTELESTSTSAADFRKPFRFDAASGQHAYNLSTKSLSRGTWQLRADLLDGVLHTVVVSLKK